LELLWDGSALQVGASVGLAFRGICMTNQEVWLAAADHAGYEAKRAGRGSLRVSAPGSA
jgi:diguanylate cyclase